MKAAGEAEAEAEAGTFMSPDGSSLTFIASGAELALPFAEGVEIAIASGEMDLPFLRPLGESMICAWS